MLRALLMDLDDTLLDLDGDQFFEAYIEALTRWMHPLVPAEVFGEALWSAAIPLMVKEHEGISNREVLWQALGDRVNLPPRDLEQRFLEFIAGDLSRIFPGGRAQPGAHRLLEFARTQGWQLAVATMPIYPRRVVDERLRRAGLDRQPWNLVATYEMCTVKPHPSYYLEVAEILGTSPKECLMIGDDYFRDIAPARDVGMETYYVGSSVPGLSVGPSGSLVDLVRDWERRLVHPGGRT